MLTFTTGFTPALRGVKQAQRRFFSVSRNKPFSQVELARKLLLNELKSKQYNDFIHKIDTDFMSLCEYQKLALWAVNQNRYDLISAQIVLDEQSDALKVLSRPHVQSSQLSDIYSQLDCTGNPLETLIISKAIETCKLELQVKEEPTPADVLQWAVKNQHEVVLAALSRTVDHGHPCSFEMAHAAKTLIKQINHNDTRLRALHLIAEESSHSFKPTI